MSNTVTVKNDKGEVFELPFIYAMPRPVYKGFAKASEVALEINEATATLKSVAKDDEMASQKAKFQLDRIKTLGKVYEDNFEKIEESMNEFIPGWKEFSYGLSQKLWTAAIGKVLGTGVLNPNTVEYDEKLDFSQPL